MDMQDCQKLLNSSCVIFAIDSNEETRNYVNRLLQYLEKMSHKPKLLIDLATPPIVKAVADVTVVTIEDLSQEAGKNIDKRSSEINKVRNIIDNQLDLIIGNLEREIGKKLLNEQKIGVSCKLDAEKLRLLNVRNDGYKSIRSQLDQAGFIEVTTPYIVGISTDPPKIDKGGAIDVAWHGGSKAFLRQSNQLYKQMIIASGLSKIYEVGPFWRAETFQSYRHLQESIGLDVEFSEPKNLEEVYSLAYSVILNVKEAIFRNYELNVYKDISLPDVNSIPVITYMEAINVLNSRGYSIALGEDLGLIGEAKLGQIIKRERDSDVFVVRDYPDTIKKFYTKKKEGGLTETFDIILCGWELVSGAVRETDRSVIEKSMCLSGIDTNNYNFYLSVVDGAVPHGGFCLGIDRLIAKLLDLEMVSEAVAFPRTFKNLIP